MLIKNCTGQVPIHYQGVITLVSDKKWNFGKAAMLHFQGKSQRKNKRFHLVKAVDRPQSSDQNCLKFLRHALYDTLNPILTRKSTFTVINSEINRIKLNILLIGKRSFLLMLL